MTNRPKAKGTAHETAIVRHVNDHGLPAERDIWEDWRA